ncbi:MAG: hypothetical protein H6739_27000 [Alphaproteobacteria bacterium]|nr:hypothetical protein [Alphaproteobacteria bacterium]
MADRGANDKGGRNKKPRRLFDRPGDGLFGGLPSVPKPAEGTDPGVSPPIQDGRGRPSLRPVPPPFLPPARPGRAPRRPPWAEVGESTPVPEPVTTDGEPPRLGPLPQPPPSVPPLRIRIPDKPASAGAHAPRSEVDTAAFSFKLLPDVDDGPGLSDDERLQAAIEQAPLISLDEDEPLAPLPGAGFAFIEEDIEAEPTEELSPPPTFTMPGSRIQHMLGGARAGGVMGVGVGLAAASAPRELAIAEPDFEPEPPRPAPRRGISLVAPSPPDFPPVHPPPAPSPGPLLSRVSSTMEPPPPSMAPPVTPSPPSNLLERARRGSGRAPDQASAWGAGGMGAPPPQGMGSGGLGPGGYSPTPTPSYPPPAAPGPLPGLGGVTPPELGGGTHEHPPFSPTAVPDVQREVEAQKRRRRIALMAIALLLGVVGIGLSNPELRARFLPPSETIEAPEPAPETTPEPPEGTGEGTEPGDDTPPAPPVVKQAKSSKSTKAPTKPPPEDPPPRETPPVVQDVPVDPPAQPETFETQPIYEVGYLRIMSRPNATISINGRPLDSLTPIERLELKPGVYVVRATVRGYGSKEQTIRIDPGGSKALQFTFN